MSGRKKNYKWEKSHDFERIRNGSNYVTIKMMG